MTKKYHGAIGANPNGPSKITDARIGRVRRSSDLLYGLENGMTLLEACRYSDNDPKLVTEAATLDPTFLAECRDGVRKAANVYLSLAEEHEKAGRFQSAVNSRERAKRIVARFILWGSAGSLDTMDTDNVVRVIREMEGNMAEAAHAVGVTNDRLSNYLAEHDLYDLLEHISHKRNW